MSYIIPVAGYTGISTFWAHKNRSTPSSEAGVDLYVPMGTPIVAPADGRVVSVGGDVYPATGRFLTIDLDDGRRVRFLHMQRWTKTAGDRVRAGAVVGYSGASGYGSEYFGANGWADFPWGETGGPHVHVTLWPEHAYSFGAGQRTLDFMAYAAGTAGGGAIDWEDDDMPTAQEIAQAILQEPAYTGGPQYSQMLKNWDQGGFAEQFWARTVDRSYTDEAGQVVPLFVSALQELADAKTLALRQAGRPTAEVVVDVDEAAVAASILAALPQLMSALSEDDVRRIARASAEELASRLGGA